MANLYQHFTKEITFPLCDNMLQFSSRAEIWRLHRKNLIDCHYFTNKIEIVAPWFEFFPIQDFCNQAKEQIKNKIE